MTASPHSPAQRHETGATRRLCVIVANAAELGPDEVDPDARFYDDLLLDSLQKLEIVVGIERAFGVKLTDREAADLHRVSDALDLLRGKGALDPAPGGGTFGPDHA